MTSNLGTGMVEKNTSAFRAWPGRRQRRYAQRLLEALKHQFRPEFLNRIDDIIVFNTLSREHLSKIVDIQLNAVARLFEARKMKPKSRRRLRTASSAKARSAFGARRCAAPYNGWCRTRGARTA